MCEHTCYNICRHEDREGQLRFRPKLARRLIAALIAALIAGLVSGPAAIQAALELGGHVGAARVSRPPAALTPQITANPSSAVPNQAVVLIGSGFNNITVAWRYAVRRKAPNHGGWEQHGNNGRDRAAVTVHNLSNRPGQRRKLGRLDNH